MRGPTGGDLVTLLVGPGRPDLSMVEGLAWLQLLLRRAGGDAWLEEVSDPLGELLHLMGLQEQLVGGSQAAQIGVRLAVEWDQLPRTEKTMTDSIPPIGLGATAEEEQAENEDAEDADAADADTDTEDRRAPDDKTGEEVRVEGENDLA
jgi:hypothetical protein